MTLSDFIEELEIAIKQDGHDIYCTADTAEMIKRHLLLNSQYFQQKEKTNERNSEKHTKGALNDSFGKIYPNVIEEEVKE